MVEQGVVPEARDPIDWETEAGDYLASLSPQQQLLLIKSGEQFGHIVI